MPTRLATLLLLLSLGTALIGCAPKVKCSIKYGIGFNTERIKRGIPPIPTSWSITDMGRFFDCADPNPDQTKPHHLAKRVFADRQGNIDHEEDYFYSGKSFYWKTKQENVNEEITLHYDYSAEHSGNPWRITGNLVTYRMIVHLSLEEADRILKLWGLSR